MPRKRERRVLVKTGHSKSKEQTTHVEFAPSRIAVVVTPEGRFLALRAAPLPRIAAFFSQPPPLGSARRCLPREAAVPFPEI